MESIFGWQNISNPIQGSSVLGKYKIKDTHKDWKNTPGNHFAGGIFLNKTELSIINKIIIAGCLSIPSYHPDYYTEKWDWCA